MSTRSGVRGSTLPSDGSGVYLARGDEQIIDLVEGGQAVFGLALGQVATDMTATLTHLPAETLNTTRDTPPAARPCASSADQRDTIHT